jgi:O-antigen ligase
MKNFIQRAFHHPLSVTGALWPMVMLASLAQGIPKPTPSGLFWRQEIALGLLFCVTLGGLARRGWRRTETGWWSVTRHELLLLLPLMLFVLWSAASLLWAASSVPALDHTFRWGAYLLFFALACHTARRPRLLYASLTSLAVVVWILSISCMIEFWGSSALEFRHSIGLGEPLAVATPLFVALALRLRQRRAALLCGATGVMAWLATLQTSERAPVIAAGVALMALACASIARRRWRPRSLSRALLLLASLIFVTALQTLPTPLAGGRASVLTRLQSTSTEDQSSARHRFLFWGIGWEMLRARPLTGVGANNYEVVYPEARARFAARYSGSPLIQLFEDKLAERAHNEYVQILSELGAVGFVLFALLCASLIVAAALALASARSPLALGAACSLLAFAISSGASSVSFRWMGSGLLFFFAAAVISRLAADGARRARPGLRLTPAFGRTAIAVASVFALVMLCGMAFVAMNNTLHGAAQASVDKDEQERLYQSALRWNPFDAGTHYNYGVWLYHEKSAAEAVPHLRYATARGFNASVCYAYLAAAQAGAGEAQAAEATLAHAVNVYPRSVFLRVRHATALRETGRTGDADVEFAVALRIDSRAARGWRQLIDFGVDAASVAARDDQSIALPGELSPENCVFVTLAENERRTPPDAQVDRKSLRVATR